jgi:AcrR family transcriptional regulator
MVSGDERTPGPRPSKKDVLVEFRRNEILEAARRVFATIGFEAATVDDIAREAGIAKGTIYLYYRSKGDIYAAAVRAGLRELHEQVATNVRAAPTAHQKVRAFIETKARYFERHVDFFHIYYAELNTLEQHSSEVHADHERLHLEQVALLEAELAREFPERQDLHGIALGISALSYGVINRRLRGWSTSSLENDIDAIVRFAWLGVAGT